MMHVADPFAIAQDFKVFARSQANRAHDDAHRIRWAAAELFRQGRLAEADLLTHEALQQHPDNEDVLVIRALICEVRHEWAAAAAVLQHLLELQGTQAPAETWCHRVRVLRCDGQIDAALDTALEAHQRHPGHPGLARELAQLEAMGSSTACKGN